MTRPKPFLKWAGGKTQVLKYIHELIKPLDMSGKTYFEPFLGGGALLFSIHFQKAIVNDLNNELINTYREVKYNVEHVIQELKKHVSEHQKHAEKHYYDVRSWDRTPEYRKMNATKRAARIIYLNKTCYNGLYRVNSKGEFNTPIGRYNNPKILDEHNLKQVSDFLNENEVDLISRDFENAVEDAREFDLVYFDPPYDYDTKGFVSYNEGGFNKRALERLRDTAVELINKGVYVIISNHDTETVQKLFIEENDIFDYQIVEEPYFKVKNIETNRTINSKSSARSTKAKEVLIYGKNLPSS